LLQPRRLLEKLHRAAPRLSASLAASAAPFCIPSGALQLRRRPQHIDAPGHVFPKALSACRETLSGALKPVQGVPSGPMTLATVGPNGAPPTTQPLCLLCSATRGQFRTPVCFNSTPDLALCSFIRSTEVPSPQVLVRNRSLGPHPQRLDDIQSRVLPVPGWSHMAHKFRRVAPTIAMPHVKEAVVAPVAHTQKASRGVATRRALKAIVHKKGVPGHRW